MISLIMRLIIVFILNLITNEGSTQTARQVRTGGLILADPPLLKEHWIDDSTKPVFFNRLFCSKKSSNCLFVEEKNEI